jgi:acetyl-CoA carboxylase biotin carboxylase subunit
VDLVQQQFHIAANRPLDLSQDAIGFAGHAIEFRINAEDPDQGFRPDPGTIREFRAPTSDVDGVSVRWDSAVRAGYRIPPHYDSLIGKLIVHAGDRDSALAGARDALGRLHLEGVRTTVGLHLRLLDAEAIRTGEYDIDYLDTNGVPGDGAGRPA